jgi:dipeptidyl-peptidase-4
MRRILILAIAICTFPTIHFAQNTEPLTLERLWMSGEFRQARFGSVEWHSDGERYFTTSPSETAKGRDFILTKAKSGKSTTLVKAEDITPEGKESALKFQSYSWSKDYSKLLLFTNTRRVWRSNTKGDYWIYDINKKSLRQLGKSLPSSSLMFAKLSPDQSSVAYVSEFNIYVEDLASGEIEALTTDGTVDIINGTFDWVYEEELSCRDGFRWSPDGKTIAFWQLDATNIRDFLMINNTDSLYPFLIPVQYPKAGEDPSRCRIASVDIASKKRTWMDIPGDQIQNYIPRIQWVENQVMVQQLDRHQQNLTFWLCDPSTGKSKSIYTENDPAYIEIMNNDLSATRRSMTDLPAVNDGTELVHVTEKDGWRHLYAVKTDGSGERLITNFDYEMASMYCVDDNTQSIYFSASPDNPNQRFLYAIGVSGNDARRITPAEFGGINRYSISPNGKYAVHHHSSTTQPRTSRLVSLPSHKTVRVLEDNKDYIEHMKEMAFPMPEFISVTTEDGLDLPVRVLKPSNFDPSKKYPVLFHVYSEPWGQTCVDSWGFGYDNVIAEMGYIVMTMDNRGTPCPRGREWRKSCYRQLGRINISDQAQGASEIVKLPYVDADRIAVWGWSGGGTTTLGLMFQYPEIYSCGIAVAPVPDLTLYDNLYQERYMGLPQETMDDYIAGSAVTHAKNLEGDLLIVHGTGDDNVHYQGTERLINELVKHNKMFQMMSYPNRSHGIYEGAGTTMHNYTNMIKFLTEHVEAGGM